MIGKLPLPMDLTSSNSSSNKNPPTTWRWSLIIYSFSIPVPYGQGSSLFADLQHILVRTVFHDRILNMIFLDADVVSCLIQWVEQEIDEARKHPDEIEYGGWDPNDLVIFNTFVLPVLHKHRHTGVDSREILDKGYGFITINIPNIIKNTNISIETKGKLMKIGYIAYTKTISDYVMDLNPKSMVESRKYIENYVEQLRKLQNLT